LPPIAAPVDNKLKEEANMYKKKAGESEAKLVSKSFSLSDKAYYIILHNITG